MFFVMSSVTASAFPILTKVNETSCLVEIKLKSGTTSNCVPAKVFVKVGDGLPVPVSSIRLRLFILAGTSSLRYTSSVPLLFLSPIELSGTTVPTGSGSG